MSNEVQSTSSDKPASAEPAAEPAEPQFDPAKIEALMEELKLQQNFVTASFAGAVAAAAGAIVWAIVTAVTKYQIGYMAIGIGFLVGIAVRYFGKGLSKRFGLLSAALALLGCLAGNLLAICIMLAYEVDVPLMEILGSLNGELIAAILQDTFSPMDLLFYGIAVYAAYQTAFRRLTEEELRSTLASPAPPAV